MNARLLPRNVRFDGGNVPSFLAGEEWVAVPAEDFDALRAEATPDNAGRSSIDVEPEVMAWFHESVEQCEHDYPERENWPCAISANHFLRAFTVAPRLIERGNGTFGFEERHFSRLDLAARLSESEATRTADRPSLRLVAEKLLAAIDAKDEANIHGWSAALRQALEGSEAELRSGRSTEDEG